MLHLDLWRSCQSGTPGTRCFSCVNKVITKKQVMRGWNQITRLMIRKNRYVRAGCPAFARPYAGVHRRTLLMSSFLLLQRCPACLFRLAWIDFVIGGDGIVGALWGNAAGTCLILLATSLCSCRLASFRAVLLASRWCIHKAVSTRPLLGRNCV